MYFLEEVVLPPGEKIRRIRGYLGLKQHEITGGKVTRNLISYIENGKTKLVKDTAKIIVDSMKDWAEKKKIPIDIDVEYLMREEFAQAKIILEGYIRKLKEYMNEENEEFQNELNKAKEIMRMWDITDKKADIYEIAADYYYKKEQYHESHINYLQSLENFIRLSNHLKTALLYSKLARCAIRLNNHQDAINLNNYALLILENQNLNDDSICVRVLFNNALAYKKLDFYDEALSTLEDLESMMSDKLTESQRGDILILKGNCYREKGNCCHEKGNYSIAEAIYKEVINIASKNNDLETLAITYMNLSELYLLLKEEEKSIECINNSLNIRLNTNYKYIDEIYLNLGSRYMSIGKYDFSEKYLLKALEESKKKNNLLLQVDIYKELIDCYMYCDKKDSIDVLLKEVRKIVTTNDKISSAKDIFLKSAYYYIEKDIKKSKELLKFGLNIAQ